MFIDRLIPDFTLENGTVSFTIQTELYPNGATVTKGPYTISTGTNKVDFRTRGRQASVNISCSDIGASWRMGSLRLAISEDGKR